ncbi:MAG TPA: hypothetical protein VF735_15085 [Pyrinomonadaceae bacterium]|jgi:hypothetical protein
MFISRKIIAIGLLLLALCAAGWTYGQRAGRVQWEYKVVTLKADAAIPNDLNKFGAEGWELIGFNIVSEGDKYGQVGNYYFKRPK